MHNQRAIAFKMDTKGKDAKLDEIACLLAGVDRGVDSKIRLTNNGLLLDACHEVICADPCTAIAKQAALKGKSVVEVLWNVMYSDINDARKRATDGSTKQSLYILNEYHRRIAVIIDTLYNQLCTVPKAKSGLEGAGPLTPTKGFVLSFEHSPRFTGFTGDTAEANNTPSIVSSVDIRQCMSSLCAFAGDLVRYMQQANLDAIDKAATVIIREKDSLPAAVAVLHYYEAAMLAWPFSSHPHHKLAVFAKKPACTPLFVHHLLKAWSNCAKTQGSAVAHTLKGNLHAVFDDVIKAAHSFRTNKLFKHLGAVSKANISQGYYITCDLPMLSAASIRTSWTSRKRAVVVPKSTAASNPSSYRPVLVHPGVMKHVMQALKGSGITSTDTWHNTVECTDIAAIETMPVRQMYVAWVLFRVTEMCAEMHKLSDNTTPLSHSIAFDLKRLIAAQHDVMRRCYDPHVEEVFSGALKPGTTAAPRALEFDQAQKDSTIISMQWLSRICCMLLHTTMFAHTVHSSKSWDQLSSTVVGVLHVFDAIVDSLVCAIKAEMPSKQVSADKVNKAAKAASLDEGVTAPPPNKRARVEHVPQPVTTLSEVSVSRIATLLQPLVVNCECVSCLIDTFVEVRRHAGMQKVIRRFMVIIESLRGVMESFAVGTPLKESALDDFSMPLLSEDWELSGSAWLRDGEHTKINATAISPTAVATLADSERLAICGQYEGNVDVAFDVVTRTAVLRPAMLYPLSPMRILKHRANRIIRTASSFQRFIAATIPPGVIPSMEGTASQVTVVSP